MLEIHHFSYGLLTPLCAYIMSVVGSLLGLRCASLARSSPDSRMGWLIGAAVSIGGTGIWVMHFIAMLGFSISGVTIRYDVALTLVSALASILVVGIGLFTVFLRDGSWPALVGGGTITGCGVAAMHYTGMAAMHTDAKIDYNLGVVALSVAIAVVASIVALWFTLNVSGMLATGGAAVIMGVAVTGMHYTGMFSMHATAMATIAPPSGAGALELLTPLIVTVSMATAAMLLIVITSEDEEDDYSYYSSADRRELSFNETPDRPSRRAPSTRPETTSAALR